MKKIILAPVGEYIDELYIAVREFPTERVILLTPTSRMKLAEKAKENLEKFRIPTKIIEIKGNIWEDTFKEVAKIRKIETGEVIIHVSTGDRESRCAATSAAFVNGLKAFAVDGDRIFMLPVLRFSYESMLTDKKMRLLKILHENKDSCSSLVELSRRAKMSLPLVSYHVNGTMKCEGLKQMGLVETKEEKGRMSLTLSLQGKMLLEGYLV